MATVAGDMYTVWNLLYETKEGLGETGVEKDIARRVDRLRQDAQDLEKFVNKQVKNGSFKERIYHNKYTDRR